MADTLYTTEKMPVPSLHVADLTYREWQVILLIAEDRSNEEIAALSKLKTGSVRTMRNRIGDKLMLKGRHKLGHFARKYRQELHDLFPILYPLRNVHDKKIEQ